MCSIKVTKIAEVYESELKKLGLTKGIFTPDFFIRKTLLDLEDTRSKLHQFIDEYVNTLRSSFISRSQKETGDIHEMRNVVEYIQSQMSQMFHLNNLLRSKNLLKGIQKISKIDSQALLHDLKVKLRMLKNERDIINVKLDEGEMVELSALLRKILSIGNKKVENLATLDADAHVDVIQAEPKNLRKYFNSKFGVAENFIKILKKANPYYEGSSQIDTKDYFGSDNRGKRYLACAVSLTNKLKLVKFKDHHNPKKMEMKVSNIKSFPKNCKTVTMPDGGIYVTGGYIKELDCSVTDALYINIEEKKSVKKAPMKIPRSSHGICTMNQQIFVCGGKKTDQSLLDSFESYDTREDKWEVLESCEYSCVRCLLIPFRGSGGRNYIYKIGGYGHAGYIQALERYDVKNDSWKLFDYTLNIDKKELQKTQFNFLVSMGGVQTNKNTMFIFGGYTSDMKPRKQSFLLSTDENENHIVSQVNKHRLILASAFSDEQTIMMKNRVIALGDQYSIQKNIPLMKSKNLVVFDHSWIITPVDK